VQGLSNVASNDDQEYLYLACSSDLVVKSMFEMLCKPNDKIKCAVLKYIGGIMSIDDTVIVNKCLEHDALNRIGNLLNV
tara:strand:- start:243 stop:479 length:237 start_codon:yes stop_codon:yes gene_type:complete